MPTSDLALVSRSLKGLLLNNIGRLAGSGAPNVKVAIGYPEDQDGAARTINLHLYHVAEDQFSKNLRHSSGDPNVATTPMSLSLFYLMTAHHSSVNGKAEVEQTIMGQALKTLHDFALIRSETMVADSGGALHPVLQAGIDDGTTTLEIILRPLTPEDALAYWASEQQQAVRLAAYYEVRLVQLQPETPRNISMPVLRVGQWVGPKPSAELRASRSAIHFARPAALGSSLPEFIEISPARAFLDLPPVDPALDENHLFRLVGTGLTSGIRRRVVISHPDFEDLGIPRGEIILNSATLSQAAARWGVAFKPEEVELEVCPQLANPLGGAPIDLLPGNYSARVEIVIADQSSGTSSREIVRRSNNVTFQLAPRIDQAQPPVAVGGAGARHRITIDLSPSFDLTLAQTVELAVDGVIYRRVAAFAGAPPANDLAFLCNTNSVELQPDFDTAIPGLHIVRLVVNGVDAQPFWLETGP